jgi:hypothetical protein
VNACLLHRTYHTLRNECWRYRIEWLKGHRAPNGWQEEFYQQAVESAILGDLWEVRYGKR